MTAWSKTARSTAWRMIFVILASTNGCIGPLRFRLSWLASWVLSHKTSTILRDISGTFYRSFTAAMRAISYGIQARIRILKARTSPSVLLSDLIFWLDFILIHHESVANSLIRQ